MWVGAVLKRAQATDKPKKKAGTGADWGGLVNLDGLSLHEKPGPKPAANGTAQRSTPLPDLGPSRSSGGGGVNLLGDLGMAPPAAPMGGMGPLGGMGPMGGMGGMGGQRPPMGGYGAPYGAPARGGPYGGAPAGMGGMPGMGGMQGGMPGGMPGYGYPQAGVPAGYGQRPPQQNAGGGGGFPW